MGLTHYTMHLNGRRNRQKQNTNIVGVWMHRSYTSTEFVPRAPNPDGDPKRTQVIYTGLGKRRLYV